MSKQPKSTSSPSNAGYFAAALLVVFEVGLIYFGYKIFKWPPSILIPSIGLSVFLGVLIVVNLFSQSMELQKAEFRSAITASLLVVYFFILAVIVTDNSEKPWEFRLNNQVQENPTDEQNSESGDTNKDETKPITTNDLKKDLIDNYTSLMMLVVGFYFGGRTAEEVAKTIKANSNDNDKQPLEAKT